MKVELKNVKTFEGHDGVGLNADIYVDGVKTAHVFDSAHGGCYEYNVFKTEDRPKLRALQQYATTLPDKVYPKDKYSDGFTCKMDLDGLVDQLFNEYETEKQNKKFANKQAKQMLTHVLVGVPNANAYQRYDFRDPLAKLPKEFVQTQVDKIKSKLNPGEVILNTNLEILGIKI